MKKVLGIILFTVFAFGFSACDSTINSTASSSDAVLGSITLEVYDTGNRLVRSETVAYSAGDTLLGLLMETYDVVCKGSDGGQDETCSFQSTYGTYIMAVDTVTAFGSNEYIAMYINAGYAMTGIDQTPLTDGYVYAFKLETF
ncbi:MAG TPA: hypothetical protein P5154_07670 [Candidatus Izemoplasmatales bacterium]|nr:hypothetical protein [Candidatus Izemoplasmatales bacterium]